MAAMVKDEATGEPAAASFMFPRGEFEVVDEDGEADFELFRCEIVFRLGGRLMNRVRVEARSDQNNRDSSDEAIFSHPPLDTAARYNFFVQFSRSPGISSAKKFNSLFQSSQRIWRCVIDSFIMYNIMKQS